ncbi:tail fiber protein [Flavobacterium sp. Root420]|uniref:tail fiber protein n=1 Tax=Flavobacterium sp. Root420 TaxID=1736533 RepID=UPI0006F23B9E|nr:tail fiber protein [Flavobacterium sp. Root420]KQW99229.1 hypothetical protein ASC72_09055 [Flavobacterium sp. Root420]
MKTKFLFLFIISFISSSKAQSYFPLRSIETNLQSFSGVNGQWVAVEPANNTLGSNYYQGLNFGFDVNNYASLVNSIGTNELYFGRWSGNWQGWNRIWHSGNLNNITTDFTAKNLGVGVVNPQAGVDVLRSHNLNIPRAIKIMYQGSWGTPQYASNYRFIDIQSTEEGNILAVNAYGMGIGFNPPSYSSPDKLYINGNVGIGTTNPTSKLTVAGNINSREVKVTVDAGADFVFENDYNLPSLDAVDKFIKENKHLPEIASADEMKKEGINLSEMNIKLLQKIEEMTLYMIEQNKKIIDLENRLKKVEKN